MPLLPPLLLLLLFSGGFPRGRIEESAAAGADTADDGAAAAPRYVAARSALNGDWCAFSISLLIASSTLLVKSLAYEEGAEEEGIVEEEVYRRARASTPIPTPTSALTPPLTGGGVELEGIMREARSSLRPKRDDADAERSCAASEP